MQWHSIVGSTVPHSLAGAQWVGPRPYLGELEQPDLGVLSSILARHTSRAEDCLLGYSTIYPDVEALGEGVPLLRLPHRDFLVLEGPLSVLATDEVREGSLGELISVQGPNLIWPADRAWCVASAVDFDSTRVGGSAALRDELMAESRLETWVVEPGDLLDNEADLINDEMNREGGQFPSA